MNIKILFLIIIATIYQVFVQNNIEKLFFSKYFNYTDIKRPSYKCINPSLNCVGMPSGHAESSALLFSLLYFYGFIPFLFGLFIVIIISFNRVFINKHTVNQVLVGLLFGFVYAAIYRHYKMSATSFIIVVGIGVILYFLQLNR